MNEAGCMNWFIYPCSTLVAEDIFAFFVLFYCSLLLRNILGLRTSLLVYVFASVIISALCVLMANGLLMPTWSSNPH